MIYPFMTLFIDKVIISYVILLQIYIIVTSKVFTAELNTAL